LNKLVVWADQFRTGSQGCNGFTLDVPIRLYDADGTEVQATLVGGAPDGKSWQAQDDGLWGAGSPSPGY